MYRTGGSIITTTVTLFFIWLTFEVHFLFIEFIDFTVRIVVFQAIQSWYSNGEGHYTSNSEVRASSWSNFTKTKIDFSFLFTLLEGKLGSQKPNKDGNESQTHGLSNALLHSSVRKVEIALILSIWFL